MFLTILHCRDRSTPRCRWSWYHWSRRWQRPYHLGRLHQSCCDGCTCWDRVSTPDYPVTTSPLCWVGSDRWNRPQRRRNREMPHSQHRFDGWTKDSKWHNLVERSHMIIMKCQMELGVFFRLYLQNYLISVAPSQKWSIDIKTFYLQFVNTQSNFVSLCTFEESQNYDSWSVQ